MTTVDRHCGEPAVERKAAKIGRCVGIVFDPEPYGDNPWAYTGKNKPKFCRGRGPGWKRGVQFMSAIQAELPDVRLLTFFHQSLFAEFSRSRHPESGSDCRNSDWALLSAFWNGASRRPRRACGSSMVMSRPITCRPPSFLQRII